MTKQPWAAPQVPENIPHGDMPGDKICIGKEHIEKASLMFPILYAEVEKQKNQRVVIAICGGSGVGKSEIASVLAYYFSHEGTGTYILSGDNYPRRIPRDNDLERVRVYRQGGLKGLVHHDIVTSESMAKLRLFWAEDRDASPDVVLENPFMKVYQQEGRRALTDYLGTPYETDFDELSDILNRYHQGEQAIYLKRMGRSDTELWYDKVDFSPVQVLIVEWTHGNSDYLDGVDIPVFLHSTPEETLAHRRARNRDGKTDSDFTTMVLEIEQCKLDAQSHKAKIILSKQGKILTYAEYCSLQAGN